MMIILFLFYKNQEFFSDLFQEKIKSIFSKPNILSFKKYYFLSENLEKKDYKKDKIRIDLIIYQVFNDITNYRYVFDLNEYVLYVALYAYIKFNSYEDDKNKEVTFLKSIYELIPKIYFEMIRDNDKWKNLCFQNWKKISEGNLL